jgi:hypothetical protein
MISEVNHLKNPQILTKPVSELPVIEDLADFMRKMHFENLQELLNYSAPDLLRMDGFGYRCLQNLYQLLQENGCEELLSEE